MTQDEYKGQDEYKAYDEADPSDRRSLLWVFVVVMIIASFAAIGIVWKSQSLDPAIAWVRGAIGASGDGSAETNSAVATLDRSLGAWVMECDTATGKICALVQSLRDVGDARLEAEWRIERAADGAMYAVWSLPTGILVRPGMSLSFDDKPPITVPYDSCAETACEVRAKLTPGFVQTMRAAKASVAKVTLKPEGNPSFAFNHDGLAEGLDRLERLAVDGPARQGD